MTPETMAKLHERAMHIPRPWNAPTFAEFLAGPGSVLTFRPSGFALGRVVLDEAELLTIAVDPAHRRQGIARDCLMEFMQQCEELGAKSAFLEVADTNAAARALYRATGWSEAGRRKRYYRTETGDFIDAILMSTKLNGG